MARAFRCSKCGLGFTTVKDEIPNCIWKDEDCNLIEVESKLNSEKKYTEEDIDDAYDRGIRDVKNGVIRPCSAHSLQSDEDEERERRMNIIAQNGNDGLHYDKEGREEDDYNG